MLHQSIKDEVKKAMRERDAVRLNALRNILAAVTNELVAKRRKPDETLEDEGVITVIGRLIKQRKEAIEHFKKGGREELAREEAEELSYLEAYMPKMMGKDEIRKIAEIKKKELNIADTSKVGMLIGAIMKELKGKADGQDVKEVVESLF
ncbi:MAG: GatB/YqeY domain-containing protein [Patescibacteria group bacterium]|mgnify:CR=1 FL=1